jgi:hypothetical protein
LARIKTTLTTFALTGALSFGLLTCTACGSTTTPEGAPQSAPTAATGTPPAESQTPATPTPQGKGAGNTGKKDTDSTVNDLYKALDLTVDIHKSLEHGPKPAADQLYVVLHDTESSGSAQAVVDGWAATAGTRAGIAAHFVIGRDGQIVQAVALDQIAHHIGAGNKGMDAKYGVKYDAKRDDGMSQTERNEVRMGYTSTGMNDYSIGIELVHNGQADYPKAQLESLDKLIAYLDAYYKASGAPDGNAGRIIQHKDWRTSNPDCSAAFQGYLKHYKERRSYR